MTVQGCGAVGCIEECLVLRAAELLRLCDAAAGARGGNQSPGTPWHGLVAWLLSWFDSSRCQLPAGLAWQQPLCCSSACKPQLQHCCKTDP